MLAYAVCAAPAPHVRRAAPNGPLGHRLACRYPRRQQATHLHSGPHHVRDGPRYFAW